MDFTKPEQHAKLMAESYAHEAMEACGRMGPKAQEAQGVWMAAYMLTEAIVYVGSSVRECASDALQHDRSARVADAIGDLADAGREQASAIRELLEAISGHCDRGGPEQ